MKSRSILRCPRRSSTDTDMNVDLFRQSAVHPKKVYKDRYDLTITGFKKLLVINPVQNLKKSYQTTTKKMWRISPLVRCYPIPCFALK